MEGRESRLRLQVEGLLAQPSLTVFDRGLLAEVYVAIEFGLEPAPSRIQKGYDCLDPATGERWEVKYRGKSTVNVDTNHIDGFSRMVLVNLSADGLDPLFWVLEQEHVPDVFTRRENHSRWQATQSRFKRAAKLHRPVRIVPLPPPN